MFIFVCFFYYWFSVIFSMVIIVVSFCYYNIWDCIIVFVENVFVLKYIFKFISGWVYKFDSYICCKYEVLYVLIKVIIIWFISCIKFIFYFVIFWRVLFIIIFSVGYIKWIVCEDSSNFRYVEIIWVFESKIL